MIGQCSGGARLESGIITAGLRIKGVNATQESVRILAGTAATKVGKGVGSGPEGLQEAKNLRGLRVTVRARGANLAGKSAAFNQSTVLHSNSEERLSTDFLPEVYYIMLAR